MAAHLARIERFNPRLNAIVAKLDDDQCLALADAADRRTASGEPLPPLHGLPTAFKDLQSAVGFPYTRGSPIYKDAMPTEDSVFVERLRRAGVLAIGKTNVPEFGMGSHTYNKVYGTTLNPYDLTKSAGGSSGGAGAALAAGLMPIADGSDSAGSLRNPGNFNNIVGFRPSVGLTPTWPTSFPLLGFSVNGPLARTVADIALLMSVMAGPDRARPVVAARRSRRVPRRRSSATSAACASRGAPISAVCRSSAACAPCSKRSARRSRTWAASSRRPLPTSANADSIFLTIRAFRSAANYGPLLAQYRDLLKPEAIAEVEQGQTLTTAAVAQAMVRHGQLLDRMRRFEERYAFTLCAVNQLPPFDAKIDWPKEIAGVRWSTTSRGRRSCYWITATFRPAISVPAGFTPEGLPVGIQIVGRYRDDFGVLQLGHAFEQATNVGSRRPPLA